MKQSFFIKISTFFSKMSKKPWACFETPGAKASGILEFSISWNDAFIEKLKEQGYVADSEEEMVQMFFLSTRVLPENLMVGDSDAVNPEAMPDLSNEANFLRR